MTVDADFGQDNWADRNATQAFIASLQLQQVQTLRTTHMTIGAFSLVVALLTVRLIISDARRAYHLQSASGVQLSFLRSINTAEVFPLILTIGAVMQQIVFVTAQATSLDMVSSHHCRKLAMSTFPAMFLMGYLTLMFGLEMALRAFKDTPFASRRRWTARCCCGIVFFLLVLTWLPTIVWPMPRQCLGSLIWFPTRYELIAIVILSVLISSSLFLAALLSIQLKRTKNVAPNERIAASRMCYYLLLAALVYSLILPVEIQAHRREFMKTYATSRMAEISLFSSGLLIGLFHLFLRANALRTVISPCNESPASSATPKEKRPKLRFFGPSDLEMHISGPLALQGGSRPDSRQGLIDVEKNRHDFEAGYFSTQDQPLSPASMRSLGPVDLTKWPLPPEPLPATQYESHEGADPDRRHTRTKSSYSLFPTRAEDIPRLPATIYTPPSRSAGGETRLSRLALRRQKRRSSLGDRSNDRASASASASESESEIFSFLTKPAPLFAGRHGRSSSTDSSATVQIGLRFSVAPATLAAAKCTMLNRQMLDMASPRAAPPLRRDDSDTSGTSLGLPIQVPSISRPASDAASGSKPSSNSNSTSHSSLSSEANIAAVQFPQPPNVHVRSGPPASTMPPRPAPAIVSPSTTAPAPQARGAYKGRVLPSTPRSGREGGRVSPPAIMLLPKRPLTPRMPITPLGMNPISPPPRTGGSAGSMRSPTSRAAGTGHLGSPPPSGWI